MKIKLLFFFIFYVQVSSSQEIKTELVSKTPLKADTFIGVDELDHTYLLKSNVLYKIRDKDTINYSNVQLGKITSVNIQNPFKIVLFYKDFNSVIILDNNLNELTNRIDLTKETLFNNVELVSISSENDLWLYASDTKLYLYDYKNHFIKFQTQPMTFYYDGFKPTSIKSTYKNIWLKDKEGVIQFNEYGNYIDFFKEKEITNIFPLKKRFVYFKNRSFYLLENKKSLPILLNYKKPIKDIYVKNTFIYICDGSNIYKFKLL
jgi:hypothetical protein